jgi:peptidoglycan/xylan/chitin deacetylase (PgdA/CDA1 family)
MHSRRNSALSGRISVVMYHYVRDLKRSRYPKIRGLDLRLFREQLAYIQKHYHFVSVPEIVAALKTGCILPPNSVLLTFDDGYLDHFTHVFPTLENLGIKGAFFPPANAILKREILTVNKIHFILASASAKTVASTLSKELEGLRRTDSSIETLETYWRRFSEPARFDSRKVLFIKRLLQRDLEPTVREQVVNRMFASIVTSDDASFASELYMTVDHLRAIRSAGMTVGGHGTSHCWLNSISKDAQIREIEGTVKFLKIIGCPHKDWPMCYPYGGFDDSLLGVLKKFQCGIAFTTREGLSTIERGNALTIERLDTNNIPNRKHSKMGIWTKRALGL